jgi:tetratricopeptide (TPR) repeat protein
LNKEITNWLRPLVFMFFAPAQSVNEVSDRASFGAALLVTVLSQTIYDLFTKWLSIGNDFSNPSMPISALLSSVFSTLFIALIFIPAIIFFTNLLERRGSFRVVLQQEYIWVAAVEFYALSAASLASIPISWLINVTGVQANFVSHGMAKANELQQRMPPGITITPEFLSENLFKLLLLFFFGLWTIVATREMFRFSWVRSVIVLCLSVLVFMVFSSLVFTPMLLSPLLLLIFFLIIRGYFIEVSRVHREREAFKKNLEIATINPADASAHYNLGLWYLRHNRLEDARKHFERTIEIDPEEVDAYYQLGRLSRSQNKLPEAIAYFEQVVSRDHSHSQHEIWREVGATYNAAKQYEDARDALERFLSNRPLDPEGLYLMGCAQAGLGLRQQAVESMRACIEAVETSPAYRYRADKRWLRDAKQFLRSHG